MQGVEKPQVDKRLEARGWLGRQPPCHANVNLRTNLEMLRR
jgi:hypothetical protein